MGRLGRIGGDGDVVAVSCCCCCCARCCFLLSFDPDTLLLDMFSPDFDRRRKLKLGRRGGGGATLDTPSGIAGNGSDPGGGDLPGVPGGLCGVPAIVNWRDVQVEVTDAERE